MRLCALSKEGREPKPELLLAAVFCDSSSYSVALKDSVTQLINFNQAAFN